MTTHKALIVDDEPDIRELLEITLIRMGIDTQSAENLSQAYRFLEEDEFQLVLTDMNLPDGNGIDLVSHIQQTFPDTPVAMITAYGSVETAINALKAGAFDFISKPVDLNQLRDIVSSALKLSSNADAMSKQGDTESHLILGQSAQIMALNQQVRKLARSQAPVYISGESGSGKELVARMIHSNGARHEAPFVPVNCGAIPSELMESEFFGHKKGSFSGAHEDKAGLFKAAHGGTLFLDEVADLPLNMQVKLLRAIQEKAIRAVGSQTEEHIDVRVLSATHKDLAKMVESGQFRQDLFYRINVIRLDVPSLRERQSDIPELAQHMLAKVSERHGLAPALLSTDAMQALQNYSFPGNVRELENIIERAFTLCDGETIHEKDLQLEAMAQSAPRLEAQQAPQARPQERSKPAAAVRELRPTAHAQENAHLLPRREDQSLEDYLESIERAEIETVLEQTKWNRTAAAKKLGISFRALRYRLKKLEMD